MATLDQVNQLSMKFLRERLVRHFDTLDLVTRGFWCITCRKPFQTMGLGDHGVLIYCGCPPPLFCVPFTYTKEA